MVAGAPSRRWGFSLLRRIIVSRTKTVGGGVAPVLLGQEPSGLLYFCPTSLLASAGLPSQHVHIERHLDAPYLFGGHLTIYKLANY